MCAGSVLGPTGRLWRALLAGHVDVQELDADLHVLQLRPEDGAATWLTEGSGCLFARRCTRELAQLIEADLRQDLAFQGVVVTGNPGIGKSWFLSYLAWRVAQLGDRTVVFESVSDRAVFVLRPDGIVREEDLQDVQKVPELQDARTVYLFDPAGRGAPGSGARPAASSSSRSRAGSATRNTRGA